MCTPRASASTSSGCAYSRSILSRTRRSRARSRRCCVVAGLLVTARLCHVAPGLPSAAGVPPHSQAGDGARRRRSRDRCDRRQLPYVLRDRGSHRRAHQRHLTRKSHPIRTYGWPLPRASPPRTLAAPPGTTGSSSCPHPVSASFAQQMRCQRVEPTAPAEHAPLPVEWDESKQTRKLVSRCPQGPRSGADIGP